METTTIHILVERTRRDARPVAVSARPPVGQSTMMRVEREALAAGYVFVLYRGGRTCKVLSASVHRHLVEMVKGRLTKRREEYAIAQVPVVEAW
jgi:hypothetical protein